MNNFIKRKSKLREGDIVWAKITGYPWWPGRIIAYNADDDDVPIAINFLGDKSHAYLTPDKVINYKENYAKYSKTKNKELLRAIRCANSIVNYPNNTKSNDESTMSTVKVKK